MIETNAPQHYRWDDMTAETLKGTITRRMITGDKMMIAEVRLAKGDTVRVHVRIKESETKERLQAFEGVCIARKGDGIRETFTVRKTSFGVGVEQEQVKP